MAVEFVVLFVCQFLATVFDLKRTKRMVHVSSLLFPLTCLLLGFRIDLELMVVAQTLLLVPIIHQALIQKHRVFVWFIASQLLSSGIAFVGLFALENGVWRADSITFEVVLVVTTLSIAIRSFWLPGHFILHALVEHDQSFATMQYALTPIGLLSLQRLLPVIKSTFPVFYAFGALALVIPLLYFSLQLFSNRSARLLPILVLHLISLQGLLGLWYESSVSHSSLFSLTVVLSALAVTGLTLTIDCLRQRYGALDLRENYGFYNNSPFLAGAFLFFGLLVANFPGTLAFEFEEAIGQIVSQTHISLVLSLLLANLMIAVSFFWMFFRLFCGEQRNGMRHFRVRSWEAVCISILGVSTLIVSWF